MKDKNNKIKETSQEIYKDEFSHEESKLKKFGLTYGLLIATIVIFIIFAVISPTFASQINILNILSQSSIIGILAIGLTIIIISGNFDFSFAANATIVSICCPILITRYNIPLLIAYLIVFGIAIGISTINGIFIVHKGLPSFIVTLGMSGILTGVSKWITKGAVLGFPYITSSYYIIGKSKIGGVFPVIVLIFLIIVFCGVLFLEGTFKGRQFSAVGFNVAAASRVGINVFRIKFEAFVIMGIIAGVGGIAIGSLYETANPGIANSYLFPVIIVALLGAVFLKEGVPNVLGTFIAAVLMAELANGFIMLGFSLSVKEVVQGLILIITVSIVSVLKPGGISSVVI
jgi:ribose transport system permease protein